MALILGAVARSPVVAGAAERAEHNVVALLGAVGGRVVWLANTSQMAGQHAGRHVRPNEPVMIQVVELLSGENTSGHERVGIRVLQSVSEDVESEVDARVRADRVGEVAVGSPLVRGHACSAKEAAASRWTETSGRSMR